MHAALIIISLPEYRFERFSMSFKYLNKIPTPAEIINAMPLSEKLANVKKERDRQIAEIFKGTDNRFLMIIGPCSADDEDAVCDYVTRLAKVQEKVDEKILIIPRIYTNKPRTIGTGYKGMLHQPDPSDKPNIVEGIKAIRRMHIRAIAESGLTPADEMLYPSNYTYLDDLLSYVAIGARSVENQQHRLTISGLDIPSGMKNPTGGDIEVMLNSIQAAQSSHVFIYNEWEVETSGNPLTHAILRGSVDFPRCERSELSLRGSRAYIRVLYKKRACQSGDSGRYKPFQFREKIPRAAAHRQRSSGKHEVQPGIAQNHKRVFDRKLH